MNFEKIKQLRPVFKHLLITVGSGILIVVIFFYVYLPFQTNHGETITVPDVTNQHVDNLDDFLEVRSLRYEINADSGYSPDQGPLTVLDQFPKANSKVKENRKIYVTLNARKAPMVKMPDLKDKSLMIAQITLQSFGLKTGKIRYRSDMALNAVLDQQLNGRTVEAGQMIPKGSVIDLYIGDGYGPRSWQMFDYVNQPLTDVKVALVGVGLSIGKVSYVNQPEIVLKSDDPADTTTRKVFVPIGTVVRHSPSRGQTVRLEDVVDLWVHQPDSLASQEPTLLDTNN